MKKLLFFVFVIILLAFSVNALKNVGESCLNDNECTSNICENSLCQSVSIMDQPPVCGDKSVGEACLNNDECQSCVCENSLCQLVSIMSQPSICGDGTCDADETCSTCQADCGSCPGTSGSPGSNTGRLAGFCIPNWDCSEYSPCIFGKKTRTCKDLNECGPTPIYDKPAEEMRCEPPVIPTCNDGILNKGETGIDCGGPCLPCATCYDEIENCHDGLCEEGVDCGGPCMPCSWWKVSGKATFWIIFITSLLVLIVLILGLWYWKLNKGAGQVGKQVNRFKPPIQPSSRLGI